MTWSCSNLSQLQLRVSRHWRQAAQCHGAGVGAGNVTHHIRDVPRKDSAAAPSAR
jgi:hypothetical protein